MDPKTLSCVSSHPFRECFGGECRSRSRARPPPDVFAFRVSCFWFLVSVFDFTPPSGLWRSHLTNSHLNIRAFHALLYSNASRFTRNVSATYRERKFFIDNLLVRIHFIIVMIRWTGLAPWGFEFLFPGSSTSTFLGRLCTFQGELFR